MTAEDGKECYNTLPSENIITAVIVNTWQLQLLTQNPHKNKKISGDGKGTGWG